MHLCPSKISASGQEQSPTCTTTEASVVLQASLEARISAKSEVAPRLLASTSSQYARESCTIIALAFDRSSAEHLRAITNLDVQSRHGCNAASCFARIWLERFGVRDCRLHAGEMANDRHLEAHSQCLHRLDRFSLVGGTCLVVRRGLGSRGSAFCHHRTSVPF